MKVLVVDDEPDVANLVKMGIAYQRPAHRLRAAAGGPARHHIALTPTEYNLRSSSSRIPDG
jgi:DNA-binding response OmpR family regulator